LVALNKFISASEVRDLANLLDLKPSKKLGQNFVIDPNSIDKIIRNSDLTQTDTVLEIGPGLGSLTIGLIETVKQVIAVEVDSRLANQLELTLKEKIDISNLQVINKDFLEVTKEEFKNKPTALVANLPYNLSVPILIHALLNFPSIEKYLIMVQAEVADRICAAPNSRIYGIPSVKIQYLTEAKNVGEISRKVFWPEPNVDSALVKLQRKDNINLELQSLLFKLVEAAFGQRRKMLRSTLKSLSLSAEQLEELFEKSQIDPRNRAEQLAVSDYEKLATTLAVILSRS
jgi:16S rRNA (adenine1518-N6/adenine1519-N6)-dimethyltransferase